MRLLSPVSPRMSLLVMACALALLFAPSTAVAQPGPDDDPAEPAEPADPDDDTPDNDASDDDPHAEDEDESGAEDPEDASENEATDAAPDQEDEGAVEEDEGTVGDDEKKDRDDEKKDRDDEERDRDDEEKDEDLELDAADAGIEGAVSADGTTTPVEEKRFVDLPEAISLALTRSPQIDAAELSSQKAALRVDEAAWAWSPKLELTSTIAPFPEVRTDETTDEDIFTDASGVGIDTRNKLEVVVPVFTFLKISTAKELAEIGLDVERLREEEARLQVTFDVTRAFYGLQLAKALETVLDDAQGKLDQVQGKWQDLYDKGSDKVERTDKYEIDIARYTLQGLAREAEEGRILARQALRVHTKLDEPYRIPKMRFRPDDVTLRPAEEVREIARKRRVDLQMLGRGLEAARVHAHLEWLKWWPDFFVAAGITASFNNAVPGSNRFYDHDPYNSFGAAALLGMRWKLDPANRAFKVEQAETEAAKIEAQQSLAIRGAMLQVDQGYEKAMTRQTQLVLARKARRAAKRIMSQEVLDYLAGGGDIDDVVSSVRKYFDARAAYLVALHDFRVALAKLRLLTGAESVDALLAEGEIDDYVPHDADEGDDDDD